MDENTSSMDQKINVYIWDMDETLILLKSLLNRTYAEAFNGLKNIQEGLEIGKMWEKHILALCDDHFFYEQIENYNQPSIDVLSQYDDGQNLSDYDFDKDGFGPPYDGDNKRKLAYRHRVIAHRYKQGLHSFLNQEMIKDLDELYDMTDKYTDRWLSSAHAFLGECSAGHNDTSPVAADVINGSSTSNDQHVNLLVTSGSLIPSLVKCLLFRLDNMITHGNVYSSWEVGKLQCFQWIKARFNSPNVRFCVIGDGWEECEAAQVMRWPFIKIDMRPGSSHRFPGLTSKTVGFYFSVVYGNSDAEDEKEFKAIVFVVWMVRRLTKVPLFLPWTVTSIFGSEIGCISIDAPQVSSALGAEDEIVNKSDCIGPLVSVGEGDCISLYHSESIDI